MNDKEYIQDLEMARKRDHKIMITDEAIAKVPAVRYREIPEREYPLLRELAQDVLRIAKEQNDSNEVAITYSLESELLAARNREYLGVALGDEHSVNPEDSTVAYHLLHTSFDCVVITLHNHPSLSKISLSDVRFFLQHDSVKMMVVITNLGSISYIVKQKKYDRNIATELYNRAVELHCKANGLKGYQDAAEYFLKNCYTAHIIYEDR